MDALNTNILPYNFFWFWSLSDLHFLPFVAYLMFLVLVLLQKHILIMLCTEYDNCCLWNQSIIFLICLHLFDLFINLFFHLNNLLLHNPWFLSLFFLLIHVFIINQLKPIFLFLDRINKLWCGNQNNILYWFLMTEVGK